MKADAAQGKLGLGRPDIGGTYLRRAAGVPDAWHSGIAAGVSSAMREGSPLGRLLVTLDDKDDNLLREWTLASDAPKTWTRADEWKLIANAVRQMRKNKIRRLLLQVGKLDKDKYFYEGWTGDKVSPGGRFSDGTSLGSMYFNAAPIRLGGSGGEKKAAEAFGVYQGRLEKRAARGGIAGRALKWLGAYMSRGKQLRSAIQNIEGKGRKLQDLLNKRTADAALLRKYRPLVNDVRRFARSGEAVRFDQMDKLDSMFASLSNESRLGRLPFMPGLGRPSVNPGEWTILGNTAFPASRLDSSDLARIKEFLAPHRSSRADKQMIKELRQYLGANSVSSADVLRNKLRRYHLTNTAVGLAGAAGLGSAGYGAYKALSGDDNGGVAE